MFIKLVKYEWIAMIRKMVPIYVAVIAVAALNYFLYRDILRTDLPLEDTLFGAIQALSAFVYFGLMVGLVAITILLVVQRFYDGLLKEEGYLMFTLPVRSWALALSKALVSILICILSFLVAVLSICILGGCGFHRCLPVHTRSPYFPESGAQPGPGADSPCSFLLPGAPADGRHMDVHLGISFLPFHVSWTVIPE